MIDKPTMEIMKEVHSKPSFQRYNETAICNSTNCYSHALGSVLPYPEKYRIGAICAKKPIRQVYFSTREMKKLLLLDFQKLNLEIVSSSWEEELEEEQFKIALFVEALANGEIFGFHFWRSDDGKTWTEKWPGRNMQLIENCENELKKMTSFPWSLEGIYKISR